MSFLKKLFGGSGGNSTPPTPTFEPEVYKEFTLTPTPISEGQGYRISAKIEKQVDGEVKLHTLIRADTLNDLEAANTASLAKARQMVDEQGEGVFR